MPAQTDGLRNADDDNPEGYLEWEAIKRIAKEPQLLDEPGLERKAIKIISALLPSLPRSHKYRVLFMRRPVAEIAASQTRMIKNRGTAASPNEEKNVVDVLQTHANSIRQFLRSQSGAFQFLEVDFPSLIADPAPWISRIADFVGADLLPHPEQMNSAVRRDL